MRFLIFNKTAVLTEDIISIEYKEDDTKIIITARNSSFGLPIVYEIRNIHSNTWENFVKNPEYFVRNL